MIKATGYLPSNLVTENAFIIGNLFQIMVLGIAMNFRQQQIQFAMNVMLERMVSNRTAELELANINYKNFHIKML